MAQRDPVVEYQREGYDMFMGMLEAMKEETVSLLFNAQIQTQAPGPALGTSVSDMLAGAGLGEQLADDDPRITYSFPD